MDFKQVESGRIRCAVRLQDSTEPVIHTDFGYNVVEQDRGQRYCPDDLRSAMCPSQNPTNSSLRVRFEFREHSYIQDTGLYIQAQNNKGIFKTKQPWN